MMNKALLRLFAVLVSGFACSEGFVPTTAPVRRTAVSKLRSAPRNSLGNLSAAELKRLLDDRGVDWRDCLEKAELVSRLEQALADGKAPLASSSLMGDEWQLVSTFERSAPSVAFVQVSQGAGGSSPVALRAAEGQLGAGSGFVWDATGHVVTNYHVINPPNGPRPRSVQVTLQGDSKLYNARVVGTEPEKDIAVLKVDAPTSSVKPVGLGNSSTLRVGQSVMAIGNPFGLDYTLTTGVVSALGREVKGVGNRVIRGCVQTDAAINPGNSGGPLLDSQGRLIGMNTAIITTSGSSSGIGFAVPVDTVRRVANQIIRFGRVKRPSLGVTLAEDPTTRSISQQLGRELAGVLIMDVQAGGPADKAGLKGTTRSPRGQLQVGDVITIVGETAVRQVEDVLSVLEQMDVSDSVELVYMPRGTGTPRKIKVQLVDRTQLQQSSLGSSPGTEPWGGPLGPLGWGARQRRRGIR